MKLSIRATAITCALIWAGALFFVGLINRFSPEYGWWYLKMVDSIYPGYTTAYGLKNLMFGVGYAIEIKNGKLGRVHREVTISGVAFEMLKTVDAVSSETTATGPVASITLGAPGLVAPTLRWTFASNDVDLFVVSGTTCSTHVDGVPSGAGCTA